MYRRDVASVICPSNEITCGVLLKIIATKTAEATANKFAAASVVC